MGMFDSVRVPCPKCGAVWFAQSKGGDCILRTYDLADAPVDVLSDVNRHPMTCEECGEGFRVEVKAFGFVVPT